MFSCFRTRNVFPLRFIEKTYEVKRLLKQFVTYSIIFIVISLGITRNDNRKISDLKRQLASYWLHCVMHTLEVDSHGGMHTSESDSAVCTPWMHTVEFFRYFVFMNPRCGEHSGVRLRGMMHTWSFLKIRISLQNRNRMRKYFSLFIRCTDGFESWNKWSSKISWHTPFNSKVSKNILIQIFAN